MEAVTYECITQSLSKNLEKTAKRLTADLLFPFGLFLQNLQELYYVGAALLTSHTVEIGDWQ